MPCNMNEQFSAWASRPEVQAMARSFIVANVEDAEKDLAKLEPPKFLNRLMNFGIIDGMNSLYWKCEKRLTVDGVAGRGDFNSLAMLEDPEWRQVLAIFAWAIGFRGEGELAAPTGCTPQLKSTSM
jgi:hypothetical protein